MWINILLQSLTEEAWQAFEKTFTPYAENDHEILGTVPSALRPFYVARYIVALEHAAATAAKRRGEGYADLGLLEEKFATMDLIIATSLKDAGVAIVENAILGADWQLLKVRPKLIVQPTASEIRSLPRTGEAFAAVLIAKRSTSHRPSTARIGL